MKILARLLLLGCLASGIAALYLWFSVRDFSRSPVDPPSLGYVVMLNAEWSVLAIVAAVAGVAGVILLAINELGDSSRP